MPRKLIFILNIISILKAEMCFYISVGNDQKKEAKKEGTWVQLKCQPAVPKAAYCIRTKRKEPERMEPISY